MGATEHRHRQATTHAEAKADRAVQLQATQRARPDLHPADTSLHASPPQLRALDAALLQFRSAVATRSVEETHAIAASGMSGGGQRLPYATAIQRAFGHHDISSVRAHTGPQAQAATRRLGAHAYATDGQVVLGPSADLHTVAHEAAHVVQQRRGVALSDGLGRPGDVYERHADAVADRVVSGRSAVDLLDAMAGTGGSAAAVQLDATGMVPEHQTEASEAAAERESGGGSDGDLVAPGGRWNARAILNRLTQLDDTTDTEADEDSCVPSSMLAVHITTGHAAVARVAADTLSRNPQGVNRRVLARLENFTRPVAQWRYQDLHALAEAMYRVGRPSGDGQTTPDQARRLQGLGHSEVDSGTGNPALDSMREMRGGENARFDSYGEEAAQRIRERVEVSSGEHQGIDFASELADMLRQTRNVGVVLGIRDSQGRGHAISIFSNANGGVRLYDSWPREGDQLLNWSDRDADIRAYFEEPREGDRPLRRFWVVTSVIAGAATTARDHGTGQ